MIDISLIDQCAACSTLHCCARGAPAPLFPPTGSAIPRRWSSSCSSSAALILGRLAVLDEHFPQDLLEQEFHLFIERNDYTLVGFRLAPQHKLDVVGALVYRNCCDLTHVRVIIVAHVEFGDRDLSGLDLVTGLVLDQESDVG